MKRAIAPRATSPTMRKMMLVERGCGAHDAMASAAPSAPISVAMKSQVGRAGFSWEEFMGDLVQRRRGRSVGSLAGPTGRHLQPVEKFLRRTAVGLKVKRGRINSGVVRSRGDAQGRGAR